jgi:hypothetical protein
MYRPFLNRSAPGVLQEALEKADFVCPIGTPAYRQKDEAEGADPVVQAELRLIKGRLMKRDALHDTVIPLLREGSQEVSFPPLLSKSISVDFRIDRDFLPRLFELVLTIHRIGFDEPMARQRRAAIAGGDRRLTGRGLY